MIAIEFLSSGLLHHLSARSQPQDSSGYLQSLHYYATQMQRAASEDYNVVVSVGCSKILGVMAEMGLGSELLRVDTETTYPALIQSKVMDCPFS